MKLKFPNFALLSYILSSALGFRFVRIPISSRFQRSFDSGKITHNAIPFPDLEKSQLQNFLLKDIGRRYTELIALSWLGRAYLAAPSVFELFWPSVFRLELYEDEMLCFWDQRLDEGIVECTLKETSVVSRGIPFKIRLEMARGEVSQATLLGIGCDLAYKKPMAMVPMRGHELENLCQKIQQDQKTKNFLVQTIVSTIRQKFSQVPEAIKKGAVLESFGDEKQFHPRKDIFAREGSFEKWLQKVSGYYFAESRLQEVCFISNTGVDVCATFTFYYDPTEPVNSDDPFINVNPEVICCNFLNS